MAAEQALNHVVTRALFHFKMIENVTGVVRNSLSQHVLMSTLYSGLSRCIIMWLSLRRRHSWWAKREGVGDFTMF